jgi:hypothetical protein
MSLVQFLVHIVLFFLSTGYVDSLKSTLSLLPSTSTNRQKTFFATMRIDNCDPTTETTENTKPMTPSRKPKYYWNDIENVKHELIHFWKLLNVTSFSESQPPIPSEALLGHFERYDLRRVIAKYGGREDLSRLLGNVAIIPGKWKVAVRDSDIVQELLRNTSHGLQRDLPPLSPQQRKTYAILPTQDRSHNRWSYKDKATRKPLKYWTRSRTLQSLYEYLDDVCSTQQRPAVWMPRLAELRESGRDDLADAISRLEGATKGKVHDIAHLAGLVPYHEWKYFEGQLRLLQELRQYLDDYHDGNRKVFPKGIDLKEKKCMSLYYAVQRYGGRKFLMSRLGFPSKSSRTIEMDFSYANLKFGSFSIDFAIDLLEYIRNAQLKLKGPLKPAVIRMPTEYLLFQDQRYDLIDSIQKFGGYENVARRLGLFYFDAKPKTMSLNSSRRPYL